MPMDQQGEVFTRNQGVVVIGRDPEQWRILRLRNVSTPAAVREQRSARAAGKPRRSRRQRALERHQLGQRLAQHSLTAQMNGAMNSGAARCCAKVGRTAAAVTVAGWCRSGSRPAGGRAVPAEC